MARAASLRVLVVATFIVSALIPGGTADAHKKRYSATPIVNTATNYITSASSFVDGDLVNAQSSKCIAGRMWKVIFYPQGTVHFDSRDAGVAERTTYPDGSFHSPMPAIPNNQQFFVLIDKKVVKRSSRHKHFCGPDRSAVYTYPKSG